MITRRIFESEIEQQYGANPGLVWVEQVKGKEYIIPNMKRSDASKRHRLSITSQARGILQGDDMDTDRGERLSYY